MMRLLFHLILLAVVAIFVALNVSYTTSINLFGYRIAHISTVAVVLISLIAGVLYSFIYYALSYIRKSGVQRAKRREEKTKDREKELKEREKLIEKTGEEQTPGGAEKKKGIFKIGKRKG
jgi:uncharacterized membrane protein